jgi:hypothetical protein
MNDDLWTEDRGDGRSRLHQRTVTARVEVVVTVQRDAPGRFIAEVRRAGLLYPGSASCSEWGSTPEEAIAAALRAFQLRGVKS